VAEASAESYFENMGLGKAAGLARSWLDVGPPLDMTLRRNVVMCHLALLVKAVFYTFGPAVLLYMLAAWRDYDVSILRIVLFWAVALVIPLGVQLYDFFRGHGLCNRLADEPVGTRVLAFCVGGAIVSMGFVVVASVVSWLF
jgi:hypothetical protein